MNLNSHTLIDALEGKLPKQSISELVDELRKFPPSSLLAIAAQANISVNGEGNIVGNNNVNIIVKGDDATELVNILRTAFEYRYHSESTSVERSLIMARRALSILEEQVAGFGKFHTPIHLQIELEEKRREVAALESRLSGL